MNRLFWKIFLGFWITLVLAAGGTGAGVWLQRQAQEGSDAKRSFAPPRTLLADLAAATARHGGTDALKAWMAEATGDGKHMPLFAVDTQGNDLLGRAVPGQALARARQAATAQSGLRDARLATTPAGEQILFFLDMPAGPSGLGGPPLRPGAPPSPWLLAAMGALASIAVSALLAWYLTKPIRKLRWGFDAAAKGDLDARVGPLMRGRKDEIADLAHDFDRMAAQLQSLLASQKRLLHDVSHELRSPLARLQPPWDCSGRIRESSMHRSIESRRRLRASTRWSAKC